MHLVRRGDRHPRRGNAEILRQHAVMRHHHLAGAAGVLAQVAAAIAQAESNIDRVEYVERDSNVSAIRFSIEVHDRKLLADVIRRVRRLGVVHGVQRL